jgi:hypothetical protein
MNTKLTHYLQMMSDQGTASKPLPFDVSSSASSTELSSTNAICGEIGYQDNEDYVAPSPSTKAVENSVQANDVEDRTITSREEFRVGEFVLQRGNKDDDEGAEFIEDIKAGGPSGAPSSVSATNASFGEDKESIDVTEEPFKASCLGLIPDSDDESEDEATVELSAAFGDSHITQDDQVLSTAIPVPTSTSLSSGRLTTSTIDLWLHSVVAQLLIVPAAFFNRTTGTFSVPLDWAVNIIGEDQFGHDTLDPRKILRADSILRRRGLEAGMKARMLAWLSNSSAGEVREFSGEAFDMVRE